MTEIRAAAVTDQMVQALPADERSHLIPEADCLLVSAACVLDAEWMAEQIRLRGLIWGIEDPFVLGTLWWYSASNWLILPTLASSFLTDSLLSPVLEDVRLHWRADSRLPGASSTRLTTGPVQSMLAESLGSAIERVASICGKGERRLWSIAVDAIAGRYLWLGDVTGRESEARQTAQDLVADLSPKLPQPRFHTVPSAERSTASTFVRRGSCCLLYKVAGEHPCGNCPRQHPDERMRRMSRP